MKKLFVTMLSVLSCGAACALPLGNPADASLLSDGLFWEGFCGDLCDPCLSWCDAWSIRAGFYGDYVFNRHMKLRNSPRSQLERFEIYTNAGYFALNLWDRFDVFTTLGVSKFRLNANNKNFQGVPFALLDSGFTEIISESRFSWSVGGRATLWECGCTMLGLEGQYFRFNPNITRVTVGQDFSAYIDDQTSAQYSEWQVGLGITHRINILAPYIGVYYARSNLDWDGLQDIRFAGISTGNSLLGNAKNHHPWGYAIGVSLIDCEKMDLAVEGRFAGEKAVHVNGQIRF